MSYVLGIDLGTTYTSAAVVTDGRAEVVQLGLRSSVVPTVVFLTEDGKLVTGETANRRAVTSPGRVAREFKRRVGDTAPLLLGGTPMAPQALMASMLRAVLDQVTSERGEPPAHVAVSHPANWGPYKLGLLEQAVRLADLESATMVTEPEAAARYYATTQRLTPGDIVAVYDLGGGTFDAAVLEATPTGFEILGTPEGIEHLGGIDVDEAVFGHVARELSGLLDGLDPNDPLVTAGAARLRRDCVEAKEALSTDDEALIPVVLPGVQTEVRITRDELEAMVRPALLATIGALERALRSARVTPDQLAAVLLVGGTSRMPLVAELVSETLGRRVAVDTHPKHAVSLGTALEAETALARELGAAAPIAEVVPPRDTPMRPIGEPTPMPTPLPSDGATPVRRSRPTITSETPVPPVPPAAVGFAAAGDGDDDDGGAAGPIGDEGAAVDWRRLLYVGVPLLAVVLIAAVVIALRGGGDGDDGTADDAGASIETLAASAGGSTEAAGEPPATTVDASTEPATSAPTTVDETTVVPADVATSTTVYPTTLAPPPVESTDSPASTAELSQLLVDSSEPAVVDALVAASEPPVETTEPPVETTEPPATTEPPVETTEPPVETTEPPVETTEPPATTEPPVETTEPPVETTEPPATTEPPVETTEPPVETTEPPATTEPPVETTEPPAYTTEPTTTSSTTTTTTEPEATTTSTTSTSTSTTTSTTVPPTTTTSTSTTTSTTVPPTTLAPTTVPRGPSAAIAGLSSGRRFPVGDGPDGVVIDSSGFVWVASSFSDRVTRIDPATGAQQVVAFPTDSKPLALAVSDDAVYVTLAWTGQVARIDPTTLETQLLPVSASPAFLAWGDGSLWVTAGGANVDRIDPATYTVVATIPLEGANGIAISNGAAWVTAGPTGELVKIDLATNQVVGRYPVGANPDAIVADGDAVWLTNRGDGTVMRFDTVTAQVTTTVATGVAPAGIFIEGDRVWVTDFEQGTLTLVDRTTGTVFEAIAVGYRPLNLAAADGSVWVAIAGNDVLDEVNVWTQSPTTPRVAVTEIQATDTRFIPTFTTQNFTPSISGDLHVHLYWNSISGADAGAPGAGPWLLWDQPAQVDDPYFDIANRPAGANAICVVVATHGHAVADVDGDGTPDYDSGNCMQLPASG